MQGLLGTCDIVLLIPSCVAANVLVDAKGHVKLADFGLARVLTSPSIPGTDPHAVGGTFTHMAPEVWLNMCMHSAF